MIPFQLLDWPNILSEEFAGESGTALWQTINFKGLRIRKVEYTAGYLADHWCQKGHIVHCLYGSFDTELENGETYTLTEGMTYIVSDNQSSHRSFSATGVKLMIIDGDFLK